MSKFGVLGMGFFEQSSAVNLLRALSADITAGSSIGKETFRRKKQAAKPVIPAKIAS
jgi:hypothetical protein